MAIYILNVLSIPLYGRLIKNRKRLVFIISTQLFLILAFRAETCGVDLVNYIRYYDHYQSYSLLELLRAFRIIQGTDIPWGHESGYDLFNWVIGRLGFSFHSYLVIHAAVCMTAVSVFIYRNADDICLSYVFFLALGGYGFFFGILRLSLGFAVFLFSFSALRERRLIKYLLYTLLAVLFHTSFLLMLPLYFFAAIRLDRKSCVIVAAISVLLLIVMPAIAEMIVMPILSAMRWEGIYGIQFQWNNLFLFIVALFFAAAFMSRPDQLDYGSRDGMLYTVFAMALLLQTVSFYVSILSRFVQAVFFPIGFVFFGNTLGSYHDKRGALLIKAGVYMFLIVFYIWGLEDKVHVPYISVFG